MKKLFVILLSALSLTAVAQQKKVAVYVTGQQSGINKVLGDQLVAAFAKSGKYIAIERTASFLAELGKEQNYQRTGAVDDNELSRLGKQFGVQLVCVADVSDVFGEKYVSCRLIDVESAEVVNTSNATSKLESMQELLKVTEGLAKELTAKTVQEKAAEAAEKQRTKEETEKMLTDGFAKGYIKVGNLYITTTYSCMGWPDVQNTIKTCRIGGFSDWRLPTASEFRLAKENVKRYYTEVEGYSSIAHSFYLSLNHPFWLDGKKVDDYGTVRNPYSNHYLMLVRDAK